MKRRSSASISVVLFVATAVNVFWLGPVLADMGLYGVYNCSVGMICANGDQIGCSCSAPIAICNCFAGTYGVVCWKTGMTSSESCLAAPGGGGGAG